MRSVETDNECVFEGRLEFRVGEEAADTGVFLVRGEESFEVLAVTHEARTPLGEIERHTDGLRAKVIGVVRPSAFGAFIEATGIEICAEAAARATENLGEALLELYATTRGAPVAVEPPRRLGNMYFHPARDGVVLEQLYIEASSHGVTAALMEPESGEVWFRTIDLSSASFQDTIRGPFKLPWRESE